MTSVDACLFAAEEVPSTGRSRAHRILAAIQPVIELPALVRRGAQPQPISLDRAAQGLRGLITRCGALTVDVETSGYPVGHRQYQLRTIQLGGESAAVVFDATDPAQTAVVRELLASTPRLHAHSATARVAFTGLPLDHQQVTALLGTRRQARAQAARRVRAFGVDNPGSDQQIALALQRAGARLPLTDAGNPSVAAEVLAPMRNQPGEVGELVCAVLDYRGHDTVLASFLEPYDQLVRYGDGRVRPTVYTLGARTGRMSCVRPNCQNAPRTGGVRGCIIADPGHVLVSADFAGIELRVAAALSGDAQLARIIAEDDAAKAQDPKAKTDIHWKIARQVFGPDATYADRYAVKPMVYGKLYGAGVPTLAAQVGCGIDLAQAVVDTLDAMTPTLAQWSAKLRDRVQAGLVRFPIYSGATLHLPHGRPHAAPNYAIQRTARELLVDAMLRWRDTPWGGCVLLPVHDEIIAMVPEAEGPAATAALVACMQTQFRGVPIVAEADEPSRAWADAA